MKWLHLGKTLHNSTYNYLFIFQMMFILIIDIVFILSPSLPKVRVRVTSETETARSGPGRQEKDWPGPERGRPGGNFTIIALLLAAAAWPWLAAGGPGQAAAGQVARQGRAPLVPEPRLCGLQQISLALAGHWHSYRSLRLLLGHRIGFTQVSLPGTSLPCQKNSQQEIKFITCK